MAALLNVGMVLRWLRDEVWALTAPDAYDQITTWASHAPLGANGLLFLPYLSGERTPHNDGALRGLFAGLSPATDRAQMTQAILEGVAYSIADCVDALAASGTRFVTADAIGGGARSPTWVGILSAVLGISLNRVAEAEHGAALGAARLARLAVTGEAPEAVCATPKRIATVLPDAALVQMYQGRRAAFRRLYPAARAITA